MQSLLRTKPANLDDITVQVALVRPGPIQGKAVHPYIDARQRLREDPSYVFPVDHEFLREPLRSTFGVVVFQDQVLEVAIALAGFTVGEAEGLRRGDESQRSHDALEAFRGQFVAGAAEKDVEGATADTVFDKLHGFLGLRLPEGTRSCIRAPRVPVDVAPSLLTRRSSCARSSTSSRWASIRPPRSSPRCAETRGGSAARGRQPERRALCRRVGGGAHRPELHLGDREGRARDARLRARCERAVSRRCRPRSAAHVSPRTASRRSSTAAPATASGNRGETSCGSSASSAVRGRCREPTAR